ncbi:MAG: TauD/TfdA family dioxygenase [Alphaproteobacteria bacterium]|nr:TauD/TfdA family dioxygenase [Alphaproteobacteria bacterium]
MNVSIRALHPVIGGEVAGVDLRRPMSRDEVAAIEAGMDRYAVLVFRDQQITDEQHVAFTLNFGALEETVTGHIHKRHERRLGDQFADVSNLGKDNKPLARDDRARMFNLGNRLWHSDSSFKPVPAKYSLLSGRIVPPPGNGGNTEFADMRAAYDALDDATKAQVADLVCEHSLIYSRGMLGFTELSEEERVTFRPVRQRLVRTHPVTGRQSLYLSSHAGTIVGWPMPEARAFLRELIEHATQRPFVYAHEWRQGDLVMWDNRQTMHRVRPFDDQKYVRDVRRTTVAGEATTVAQVA